MWTEIDDALMLKLQLYQRQHLCFRRRSKFRSVQSLICCHEGVINWFIVPFSNLFLTDQIPTLYYLISITSQSESEQYIKGTYLYKHEQNMNSEARWNYYSISRLRSKTKLTNNSEISLLWGTACLQLAKNIEKDFKVVFSKIIISIAFFIRFHIMIIIRVVVVNGSLVFVL